MHPFVARTVRNYSAHSSTKRCSSSARWMHPRRRNPSTGRSIHPANKQSYRPNSTRARPAYRGLITLPRRTWTTARSPAGAVTPSECKKRPVCFRLWLQDDRLRCKTAQYPTNLLIRCTLNASKDLTVACRRCSYWSWLRCPPSDWLEI
uniref:(northern house mosquito) hypothetical protein n=1 Tax=Culex pipiens TaxID=7175 RepID=A0A8D8G783_CULPI